MADSTSLWQAVGALIDGTSVEGVLAHKLAPLAAGRRRAAGEPVPEAFAAEERAASFAALCATALLQRIRELVADLRPAGELRIDADRA